MKLDEPKHPCLEKLYGERDYGPSRTSQLLESFDYPTGRHNNEDRPLPAGSEVGSQKDGFGQLNCNSGMITIREHDITLMGVKLGRELWRRWPRWRGLGPLGQVSATRPSFHAASELVLRTRFGTRCKIVRI